MQVQTIHITILPIVITYNKIYFDYNQQIINTVYDYVKQRLTAQKQSQFLTTAAQDIAKSLDTKTSVERKKTGKALDKVLEAM